MEEHLKAGSDEVVLMDLIRDPRTKDLICYSNFHLDFGPIPWTSCAVCLHVLRCIAKEGRGSSGHRPPLPEDPTLRMLLIPVCLFRGLDHCTSLVALLGVISVFAGSLQSPDHIGVFFPEESVMGLLTSFHDASEYDDQEAYFDLSARDVIAGAIKAYRLWGRCIDDLEFVVPAQYHMEMEGGDICWMIPRVVAAFSAPVDKDGPYHRTPRGYAALFSTSGGHFDGVGHVIQLNEEPYDRAEFSRRGITHHTLAFVDGSCPSNDVVSDFFGIIDGVAGKSKKSVALHCMAGLGRTGTLVSLLLMRDYGFSAKCAIGWCRLCRPGSVIGPQQHFLAFTENSWKKMVFETPSGGNGNGASTDLSNCISDLKKSTSVEKPLLEVVVNPVKDRIPYKKAGPKRGDHSQWHDDQNEPRPYYRVQRSRSRTHIVGSTLTRVTDSDTDESLRSVRVNLCL
jgi:protein-tyrosine phosphatase